MINVNQGFNSWDHIMQNKKFGNSLCFCLVTLTFMKQKLTRNEVTEKISCELSTSGMFKRRWRELPYMAKLLNFCSCAQTLFTVKLWIHSALGLSHYVLYTANDSREKLSWLAKKPWKFSSLKVLPHTVYIICVFNAYDIYSIIINIMQSV